MVHHLLTNLALLAFFAAVLGTAFLRISVPRSGTGTAPTIRYNEVGFRLARTL
jgi:hypothetical protein